MTSKQIQKAKDKLAKQDRKEMFKRLSDYLVCISLLPIFADKIEDLADTIFKCDLTDKMREIETLIREQDEIFLTGADLDIIDQQSAIQRSFIQWQSDNFLN